MPLFQISAVSPCWLTETKQMKYFLLGALTARGCLDAKYFGLGFVLKADFPSLVLFSRRKNLLGKDLSTKIFRVIRPHG